MSDREIMNAKHPPSAREILKKEYPKLNVIIVGGFSKFLLNRIKNAIFADQDFLAQGLNYIINYNENR